MQWLHLSLCRAGFFRQVRKRWVDGFKILHFFTVALKGPSTRELFADHILRTQSVCPPTRKTLFVEDHFIKCFEREACRRSEIKSLPRFQTFRFLFFADHADRPRAENQLFSLLTVF